MAFKASIVMLACFLLVATKAAAFQEEIAYGGQPPLKPPCDDHASAPVQSSPANATSPSPMTIPTTPPTYPTPQAPSQTPASPPTTTPSPSSTPVYPPPHVAPATSPAYSTPPTVPGASSSRNHLRYCVPECQRRCIMLRDQHKILRKIRPCVHVCTACCEMNQPLCVPTPQATCPIWGSVTYHGGIRQCP